DEIRVISHSVGEHVPMSGRSLGGGPIRPEFGQHSYEVAAFDDIGSVGRASRRIIRAAMAIVGPESAVAEAAWRYVHRDAIVRSQFAAMLDDCHHVGAESGIPHTMKMRG